MISFVARVQHNAAVNIENTRLGIYINIHVYVGILKSCETPKQMPAHGMIQNSADALLCILKAFPATREQVLRYRKLRSVSTAFCTAVDNCLLSQEWTAPLTTRAAEFCNDVGPGVTLVAPAALNMGIHRMVITKSYVELREGMHEFLPDETTQEIILRVLMLHLTTPTGPGVSIDMVNDVDEDQTNATDAGMQRVIADAMRFHATNLPIQVEGCRLLACLPEREPFDVHLGVYIAGTVAAVMRRNLTLFSLQEMCMRILDDIVVHFRYFPCEDARMLLPRIIVAGDIHMPMLIARVMQQHAATADWHFMYNCVRNLKKYSKMMDELSREDEASTQFEESMAGFVAGYVEDVLLDVLRGYPQEPVLLRFTIRTLASLVNVDCGNMHRLAEGVQYALNALKEHNGDFEIMRGMMKLIKVILIQMVEYDYDEQERSEFQNAMMTMGFIPHSMAALRSSVKTNSEPACILLFFILDHICEQNPLWVTLVRNENVIAKIDGMFAQVVDKARDWEPHRTRLVNRVMV